MTLIVSIVSAILSCSFRSIMTDMALIILSNGSMCQKSIKDAKV